MEASGTLQFLYLSGDLLAIHVAGNYVVKKLQRDAPTETRGIGNGAVKNGRNISPTEIE